MAQIRTKRNPYWNPVTRSYEAEPCNVAAVVQDELQPPRRTSNRTLGLAVFLIGVVVTLATPVFMAPLVFGGFAVAALVVGTRR